MVSRDGFMMFVKDMVEGIGIARRKTVETIAGFALWAL